MIDLGPSRRRGGCAWALVGRCDGGAGPLLGGAQRLEPANRATTGMATALMSRIGPSSGSRGQSMSSPGPEVASTMSTISSLHRAITVKSASRRTTPVGAETVCPRISVPSVAGWPCERPDVSRGHPTESSGLVQTEHIPHPADNSTRPGPTGRSGRGHHGSLTGFADRWTGARAAWPRTPSNGPHTARPTPGGLPDGRRRPCRALR